MPETPLIRPLVAGDFAAWQPLWKAYLAFYETVLPETQIRAAFDRLLAGDPHDFNGLVAQVDGKLVGLTHFLFHRHLQKPDRVCYLQDLYAAPSVRGTGIGRALIEAVYKAADAAGAPSVYWLTQDFNTEARKLYDRCADLTPFIKYARRLN